MSVTDGGRLDAEAQLREDERRRLAIEAGQLGIWDWDVVRDRVEWSERVYELHGVKPGEFGGTVADFARLVHPEDAPAVGAGIERALQGGQSFEAEFRAQLADGGTRWLATRAEVMRDADGRPVRTRVPRCLSPAGPHSCRSTCRRVPRSVPAGRRARPAGRWLAKWGEQESGEHRRHRSEALRKHHATYLCTRCRRVAPKAAVL